MKICFLLPGRLDRPVGGHKVIYQHANALAAAGHQVFIVNNSYMPAGKNLFFEHLRMANAFQKAIRQPRRERSCRNWFPLNPSIKEVHVWDFSWQLVPKADAYVATDATTSPFLKEYPVPVTRKYYFIQGYENWRMNDEQLRATYHIACRKLVISRWLKEIMDGEGVPSKVTPNGYDSSEFNLTVPLEKKDACRVSMLYHELKSKNSAMGIEALKIVYQQKPELKVSMFGVYEKPEDLPDFIDYYQSPDPVTHNRLNNEAAIFIGTSDMEGWGLTILEAMACGQAVACTGNRGYLEMAVPGENALVSPVGDARAMAANIIRLMSDDATRYRLATAGLLTASRFTLEQSNYIFTSCFRD